MSDSQPRETGPDPSVGKHPPHRAPGTVEDSATTGGTASLSDGIRPIGELDQDPTDDTRLIEDATGEDDFAEDMLSAAEQQELRIRRWILALLLVTTFVVATANAWKIHKTRYLPTPFALTLESALSSPADCRIEIVWDSPGGISDHRLQPTALLDGDALPRTVRIEPNSDNQIKMMRLAFLAPAGCPSGLYSGRLEIHVEPETTENPGLLESYPVSIRVPSLLDEWSLVRDWFFAMLGIGVLAYCLCMIIHPAPTGILRFRSSVSEGGRMVTDISLRPGAMGYIWPCRRSTVKLGAVLRRNPSYGLLTAQLPSLRIEFVRFGLVTLTVEDRLDPESPICQVFGPIDPSRMSSPRGRRLGRYTLLLGSGSEAWTVVWTKIGGDGRRTWLAFSYKETG